MRENLQNWLGKTVGRIWEELGEEIEKPDQNMF